jgi:alcohol dehydrogenase (cytochrome c)/quinohemoprotein ethanol dehydrogenase
MTHGRTYDEQRFSPLTQISAKNVAALRLAWHHDLPPDARPHEATPLVVDGVMYVTSSWSRVHALDARSGALVWTYDPKVPGEWAVNACCDLVNRGAAAWNGRIYVGTIDGRLIALDAASGRLVWEVVTIPQGMGSELNSDPSLPVESYRYSITGAPRVVDGRVIIGNGGADLGVRGYVSAYDAETGKLLWRFYTVPGDPSRPFEHPVLETAAETWSGEWWKFGGGGTVWDSIAFDPKLDLVYIGVGNGAPWNQAIRSPGGGDNLFLASIVALRADTGEYTWHYQTTPGESWDFTATQHMILADLEIGGRTRPVIMQAPKNGFFYVLDRATGELLSARPFVPVNWATGVDLKSGRPIEAREARYGDTGKIWVSWQGPTGGHNWQPMSFSPQNRLVYIPANVVPFAYVASEAFDWKQLAWNPGVDVTAGAELAMNVARLPGELAPGLRLIAWDPVAEREVWHTRVPGIWNGGVLSTAGNLVFQGTGAGTFAAFQADTGAQLWSADAQGGIVAAPIAYEVDGEQFVAIEVGRAGEVNVNIPRVLAFSLSGTDVLPEGAPVESKAPRPPPDEARAAVVAQGKRLYRTFCFNCHGFDAVGGNGAAPDLRFSALLGSRDAWRATVHGGNLAPRGMVGFGIEIEEDEAEAIRAFVIHQANSTTTEVSE